MKSSSAGAKKAKQQASPFHPVIKAQPILLSVQQVA
jgi:hypothetical protein